ncbi:hypothetical protein SNE35_29360 [Paucibacter sp. R3-3]|uniref:Uncharacterized protein n=1 Tax=Roseateles agri TaxID=3098619 RepID=A0ABU5DQP3_9BURK|nr:hypothetical protein [Paucibacter sp. R3-3]MDY0748642.1 hypothetical protein [Paucibacter sp. R3-3]
MFGYSEKSFGFLTEDQLCRVVLASLIKICESRSMEGVEKISKYFALPSNSVEIDADSEHRRIATEKEGRLNLADSIYLSYCFCVHASQSERFGQKKAARSFLIDAFFHLGEAQSNALNEPKIENLLEAIKGKARSNNASSSVNVSAAGWKKVREEALRLVRERAESGARWSDPTAAARAIADGVEKFMETLPGKRFQSEKSRETAIAGWIREMPGIEEFLVK